MNSSNIYLFISHAAMVLFFVSTLPLFLMALVSRLNLKQQFAFTRLDHQTPGESRWKLDNPVRWAKENFTEKSRNMFQDQTLKSLAAVALLLVSIVDFGKSSWPIFWVSLSVVSLLIVFFTHRWIRLNSRFSLAMLVNAQSQNWIKQEVVAQTPAMNAKAEFVVVGTPETSS